MRKFMVIGGHAGSLINFRGDWLKYLLDKEYEVHACAPDLEKNIEINSQLKSMGVVCHSISIQRAGINPVKDVITILSLLRVCLSVKPDCVLFYTIKPVVYGLIASWLARVPVRVALITGLGYAFQDKRKGSFVANIASSLYRVSLHLASSIFFQNPDDKQLFEDSGLIGKDFNAFVVNGSGINTNKFYVVDLPSSPHFLMIGRLLGDKGVREYVEASLILKKKYPEVIFTLVGPIDENPDSITPVELEKWVEKGVNYLGRLSDVRPAISAASVYVLPSYREGTPRTVLEAMSMGRAVITTNAPGCKETVVDGLNGYLVPVKDVDALADAMEKLIVSPNLAKKMGKESRTIAEEKYDVHKVNEMMLRGMGI